MYGHGSNTSRLLVGIYFDDLVIIGNDEVEINHFKEEMKRSFKMSDLALCSWAKNNNG